MSLASDPMNAPAAIAGPFIDLSRCALITITTESSAAC
jgi:hypothetical protein